MRSRWSSVARGSAYAATATVIAGVSHTLVDGAAPSWFGVLATFVFAGSVSTFVAGRTVAWWRLIASVAIGQVMFHGLFAGVGAPAPVVHAHEPVVLVATGHAHGMVWAHVVAGVLTVLALRFGEDALRALAGALRFAVRDLEFTAPAPMPRLVPAPAGPAPRSLGMPRARDLRGPPIGSVQPI